MSGTGDNTDAYLNELRNELQRIEQRQRRILAEKRTIKSQALQHSGLRPLTCALSEMLGKYQREQTYLDTERARIQALIEKKRPQQNCSS